MPHGDPAVFIDASALVALLGAEPAAKEVQELLRSGGTAMTTLNLAEVVDRLQRRYRLEVAQVRPVIEGLLHESLMLLPVDAVTAWRAGELRARYYHRTRCPISLADAVLLASVPPGGHVATSDSHLLSIAAEEKLSVIVLPNSRGGRASVRTRPLGIRPGVDSDKALGVASDLEDA
jgi:PIN domain nuclease of toxin-antitoxin system